MFNGKKYLTSGIDRKIPVRVQMFLWELIDILRAREDFSLDYLQVFDLKPVGKTLQLIVHTQEVPPFRQEILLTDIENRVRAKIFVIDSTNEHNADDVSESYSTMLLAEEY